MNSTQGSRGTDRGVINLAGLRVGCKECSLSELCLPRGLAPAELEQLDSIVRRTRPLRRGQHVFRIGDHMRALYAVRSGSVKAYVPVEDGEEQVLGFFLPGELLGLDAIEDSTHACSALALETTSLCELPFETLEHLCQNVSGLQRQMNRLAAREISRDHAMLLLLGKRSAEQRLAAFLLNLSERFAYRGFSPHAFNLRMSRRDIGNYLGLALETVSRLFARFQDEGLLTVDRRLVQINDLERLRATAGHAALETLRAGP